MNHAPIEGQRDLGRGPHLKELFGEVAISEGVLDCEVEPASGSDACFSVQLTRPRSPVLEIPQALQTQRRARAEGRMHLCWDTTATFRAALLAVELGNNAFTSPFITMAWRERQS